VGAGDGDTAAYQPLIDPRADHLYDAREVTAEDVRERNLARERVVPGACGDVSRARDLDRADPDDSLPRPGRRVLDVLQLEDVLVTECMHDHGAHQ
jgi:hypothetical protein